MAYARLTVYRKTVGRWSGYPGAPGPINDGAESTRTRASAERSTSVNSYLWLFLGSTVVDAMAAGAALVVVARRAGHAGRNPFIRLRDLPFVITVAAIVFVIKIPVHRMLGVTAFGLMHLIYLVLAVLVPGAALTVLGIAAVRRPRRPRLFSRGVVALATVMVLAVPVAVWATFIEPFALRIEYQDVPIAGLEPSRPPIRIAVLADIQTDRITDYEQNAIDQAIALEPDLILLPGDFYQGPAAAFERELPAFRDLLNRLEAPGGVFAVGGNVDRPEQFRRLLANTGVHVLDNEIARVRLHGLTLAIGGMGYPHDTPRAARLLASLDRAAGDVDVAILVSHTPDSGLFLTRDSRIDLIVAGHTHGGQVQIPGIGPLLTGCRSSRTTSAGGLTTVNGVHTYVSRGVGHERWQAPRVRLCCPPEISLLTLVPQ